MLVWEMHAFLELTEISQIGDNALFPNNQGKSKETEREQGDLLVFSRMCSWSPNENNRLKYLL